MPLIIAVTPYPVMVAPARASTSLSSFVSKLSDSDAENAETQTWLEYALACEYINEELFKELINESEEVGKLINYMILNPEKFGVKTDN